MRGVVGSDGTLNTCPRSSPPQSYSIRSGEYPDLRRARMVRVALGRVADLLMFLAVSQIHVTLMVNHDDFFYI